MNASGPTSFRAVACSRVECVFPATVIAKAEGHSFTRAALCSAHYVSDAAGYRDSYRVLGLKLRWFFVDLNPVSVLRTRIEIVEAGRAQRSAGGSLSRARHVSSRPPAGVGVLGVASSAEPGLSTLAGGWR